MIIIGCDYHPGFQQIAFVSTDTGEAGQHRLEHKEQAEQFYHELGKHGEAVRVGMEASGHARWFERLLHDLQFELWIGDAAQIVRSGCASRRQIGKTCNCCCNWCWRIAFRGSGYRTPRTAICGNCCGIGIGWCRCARAS